MNPKANSMGAVKRMEPPESVPSQLKVLMADGTAMTMVVIMKAVPSNGIIPLTNLRAVRRGLLLVSEDVRSHDERRLGEDPFRADLHFL